MFRQLSRIRSQGDASIEEACAIGVKLQLMRVGHPPVIVEAQAGRTRASQSVVGVLHHQERRLCLCSPVGGKNIVKLVQVEPLDVCINRLGEQSSHYSAPSRYSVCT